MYADTPENQTGAEAQTQNVEQTDTTQTTAPVIAAVPENQEESPLEKENRVLKDINTQKDIDNLNLQNRLKELEGNMAQQDAYYSRLLAADSLKMEEYEKKIISLCSYLFFIPYYQVCIDEVAIPAFESLKGTELYAKHQIRLNLLKNYRRDIEELINFFKAYKTDKAANHVIGFPEWRSEVLAKFSNLNAVKSYKAFDFWDQTYLGHIIQEVQSTLTNGDAEKIDKTFAFYLNRLELDLKDGSK